MCLCNFHVQIRKKNSTICTDSWLQTPPLLAWFRASEAAEWNYTHQHLWEGFCSGMSQSPINIDTHHVEEWHKMGVRWKNNATKFGMGKALRHRCSSLGYLERASKARKQSEQTTEHCGVDRWKSCEEIFEKIRAFRVQGWDNFHYSFIHSFIHLFIHSFISHCEEQWSRIQSSWKRLFHSLID